MKVALFGGSFNPIHNGHLEIANELITNKIVSEVWLIPCGSHAFGKELVSAKDRIEMINLSISNPKIKIIDIEVKSDKVSYTADTLIFLKKEFNHDFYFIIGADNLENIHNWHNFGYLRKNAKFILITRPDYKIIQNEIHIAQILEMEEHVSSTKIREYIKKGISISNLVPEEVENYIKKEELYHVRQLCESC